MSLQLAFVPVSFNAVSHHHSSAKHTPDSTTLCNVAYDSLWNWHDCFEHKISSVWALTDFDEAVGATRIVIGSHAWPVGDYLKRAPVTLEDSVRFLLALAKNRLDPLYALHSINGIILDSKVPGTLNISSSCS